MKVSITFLALANTLALAQNFFSSTDVPACAVQCQLLNQAQAGCLPAVSPQPASCFCNSAYLTNLAASPQAVCPGCTSQSDLSQLTGWFTRFCQQGGSATYGASGAASSAPAGPATTAAAPAASTAAAANPAATSNTASSSSGSNGATTNTNQNQSWWDKHKGWIAMVIVLIIAFAAIIAGAVWWKKRYLRKRDAAGATLPGAWGPTSNQHPSSQPVEKSAGGSHAAAMAAGQSRTSKKQKIARSLRR
ncbi:hypothetical protein FH972_020999 [Carpinus fangiana]|uniref:CFEM domain-containing protein n=1 Tax=Carpinus fangiana TaxID=176857 RepID=A0A5N6KN26_9ROSI|nr:hypothetical protein FH972_020999 [Carpinus fangiana]